MESTEEIIADLKKNMKESQLALRDKWRETETKRGRRLIALRLLEKQLEEGVKPVKGYKPFKTTSGYIGPELINFFLTKEDLEQTEDWQLEKDEKGNFIRLSSIPLTDNDRVRIACQINSLRRKLNLA